jgi:transcriptional regulator with XRE-family HTH domain
MTARDPAAPRGRRLIAADVRATVDDLRATRVELGLSQRTVAAAAGLSQSRLSRMEREVGAPAGVVELASVAAVLGMRLRMQLYPEGEPLRDRVQAPGLDAFRKRVHPSMAWRSEVVLPGAGDRRAWDAMVIDEERAWTAIEWISRVGAVDAMLRRTNQKQRDDPRIHRVVLVVADTSRNRRALRQAIGIVRAEYPLDTREVLAALASGRAPALNGIVLLRIPRDRPQPVHTGGKVVDAAAPAAGTFVEKALCRPRTGP